MKPVDSQPDFLALERDVLDHWRTHDSFGKLQCLSQDRPLFRFVDGPITANNPMGVHHAWGRTLKDVFIRYKVMNGHRARYQNGFDCQGLWVEVEVEKALGFNGKPDIEAFGLAEFSKACRERVNKYAAVISQQSERLGQWMDWSDSYYTHDDENIQGIWHFLKLCREKGWLYQGQLPMPWCPRCGTSLSEHEMSSAYRDVEHLSLWVTVPLDGDPRRRLLLWTTTPWTLPANVAAAVNPDLEYVELRLGGAEHTTILAASAMKRAIRKGTKVEIVARFKGSDLVGETYETLFPRLAAQAGIEHRVVPWADVDAGEGSGIVHIAPGCGREDFELGQDLGLAAVRPVDEQGIFVAGFGVLEGQSALVVADRVARELERTGNVLRAEPYEHSYPHCWRCKGELIFRLVDEWFLASDEVRKRTIEAAATVEWTPAYIGKRMHDWLTNMGDWCISRKRYWGLPLPFYPCEDCGYLTVIGSAEELRARAVDPAAVDALPELHRPWIDDVRIACEACGKPVERVPEVGDCWLDAGIVPYTTLGYWENPAAWEEAFPVEWICEMREQVRLWYYSMLFMGTVISGRAPYEKVLSYERVVAEDGTTFSKTGHMIHFDEAVQAVGADAMRYLYCSQSVSSECRFGYELAKMAQRKLLSLWNVYSFYASYATIDRPDIMVGLEDVPLDLTDRWLLARTSAMIETCREAYDRWDPPAVLRAVEAYVDDLSNWYVRINRKRFWLNDDAEDQRAAYRTLYEALKRVLLVLAPITPFFTEAIWQNLVRGQDSQALESIHHASFPEPLNERADPALLERTAIVREVVRQALSLRETARMRTRQPLAALLLHGPEETVAAVREQEDLLRRQINVKAVEYPAATEAFESTELKLDFGEAGRVLRGDVSKAKAALESLDASAMAEAAAAQAAGQGVRLPGFDEPLPAEFFTPTKVFSPDYAVSEENGCTLALNLHLDQALVTEGLMRDLMRQIQIWRKEADFDLSDRIELRLHSSSESLSSAIHENRETIAEEVLARDLRVVPAGDDPGGVSRSFQAFTSEIQGHPVNAWLSR